MNIMQSMKLMEIYAACPSCGSEMIGNGAGKLIIDDMEFKNKFHRSCKCGWSVTTDEDGKEVK